MRAATSLILTAILCGGLGATQASSARMIDSYAIVASKRVMDDVAWRRATVDTLAAKYPHARLYTWDKTPAEVRDALAGQMPSFTAFVVRPEEAGVRLTIDLSHLCRDLDDDPYGDTFWGVVTGYDAEAAGQLAAAKPIAIERALDCAGCDITAFRQAWRYSEDHRGTAKYWAASEMEAVQDQPCDTDNTQAVLARLQRDRVQFLTTSGHATQHDWQMGYCGPNMAMVHKDGRLLAVDTHKQAHRAACPEPKVYIATGNCLIGDIDQPDCMALSWLRDGGVRQMVGYTVTTWFGEQGWGTQHLFVNTAGLTTANEAFHFTNNGIVHALEQTGIPDLRTFRLAEIQQVNFPSTPGMVEYCRELDRAGKPRTEIRTTLRNLSGRLHDRDTVCFYGDPALEARVAHGRFRAIPPELTAEELCLRAEVLSGAQDGAVWFRLPGSWSFDADALMASPELGTPDLVTDNFIRFPSARCAAAQGKTLTVRLPKAVRKGVAP